MKILRHVLFATGLAVLLGLGCAPVQAQLLTKFGPVNGVLVGTVANPQTAAATSTNILSLWSGSCSGTTFLNGAGACATPAGVAPTGTQNLVYATPNGSTGAATLRALVGADVAPINLGSTANGGVLSTSILLGTNGGTSNGFFSVTGPTTALRTFTFPNASATVLTDNAAVTVAQGGTGLQTLTAHGVLLGEGTSAVSPLVMGADTVLRGTASADPVATAVPNCGSGTTALNYNTTTHAFGCQTLTGGSAGVTSVTAGTGLTASPNPIIATGTVSLDLTANNAWTGAQTWIQTSTGTYESLFQNPSTGVAAVTRLTLKNSADSFLIANTSTAFSGSFMTGGSSGESANLETAASVPVNIGVGGAARLSMNNTAAGRQLDIVTNGTATGVGYVGFVDQSGTRYGYFGKSSTGTTISYESDATVQLVGNNGADTLFIDGTHVLQYGSTPVINTGTFTMSYNGFSAGCSLGATYTQAGRMVTLIIPGSAVCASNATTLTGTGIPAAIQPAQAQQLGMYAALCEDNGVIGGFTCGANISAGTITFSKNGSSSGWTASGQKGVTTNLTVTYLLN